MRQVLGTRYGFALVLVFLVLLGMVLRSTGRLGPVEDATNLLFNPVQTFILDLSTGVANMFGGFENVNQLRAQVKDLQDQLNKVTVDSVRVRELEIENTHLRQQLDYRQANPDYALVGGTVLERNPDLSRIIAQDPSSLVNYVVIDQGRDDGVAVGMPVVTPAGLVGRVSEVGTHWSRVLLITDVSSSVNAVIQSSRATGVIQGQGNSELLMKYLPQGEAVQVNDLVLTSGLGGSFPKRLVIGQVTEVHKRDTDLFQEAVVRPSVDFNRLEFVLIIKQFTPTDITAEPTPTPEPSPTPTRRAPVPTAAAP